MSRHFLLQEKCNMSRGNNLGRTRILEYQLPINIKLVNTTKAKIVKKPPVVEVSYCSVCIFLKKSKDLSILFKYNFTIYYLLT